MVNSGAHGIDVCHGSSFTSILLGGRISLSPDHCAFRPRLEDLRDPKIDQYHITVRVDHYIRRFHIAKDDRVRFMFVQKIEHVA